MPDYSVESIWCGGLAEGDNSRDISIYLSTREKNVQWGPSLASWPTKMARLPALPQASSEKRSHFVFFCYGFQLASRYRKRFLLSSGDVAKRIDTRWGRKLGHLIKKTVKSWLVRSNALVTLAVSRKNTAVYGIVVARLLCSDARIGKIGNFKHERMNNEKIEMLRWKIPSGDASKMICVIQ